jgi:hypothetical protein
VTLTASGRAALSEAETAFGQLAPEYPRRPGERGTLETMRLFNRFADIADDMSKENESANSKARFEQRVRA